MLDAVAGMPVTARAVFICSPDKKLKLSTRHHGAQL
jgi:hypothetical protein